jgi:hypothetical protein
MVISGMTGLVWRHPIAEYALDWQLHRYHPDGPSDRFQRFAVALF